MVDVAKTWSLRPSLLIIFVLFKIQIAKEFSIHVGMSDISIICPFKFSENCPMSWQNLPSSYILFMKHEDLLAHGFVSCRLPQNHENLIDHPCFPYSICHFIRSFFFSLPVFVWISNWWLSAGYACPHSSKLAAAEWKKKKEFFITATHWKLPFVVEVSIQNSDFP